MSWANTLLKMTLTKSTPYTLRPSLAYRQNLLSSLKTKERHFSLQPTLSLHQISRAWRCRGVSGSLARGTRDLGPAASRRWNMFPDFFPGCCSGGHRFSHNTSILTYVCTTLPAKNLVYGCGMGMFHRPPINCAQNVQQ